MARYRTTVPSRWPIDEAFAYMADFTHSAQWDPSVTSARRVGEGDVGLGTTFELVTTFNGRPMPLTYVVTAFEPPRRVALRAQTPLVLSVDEITFSTTPKGTDVTYDATLHARGWLRLVSPVVSRLFKGIGDRARTGLVRELNAR